MRYFIFLLFTLSLQAQVVFTETFNNFTPALADSTKLAISANNASIIEDSAGVNPDLTIAGWSNIAEINDSLIVDNIIILGGNALPFDGVDQALVISHANQIDLEPLSSDFTLSLVFKRTDELTATSYFVNKLDVAFPNRGYALGLSSLNDVVAYEIKDASNNQSAQKADPQNYDDGEWHIVHLVKSGTDFIIYTDQDTTQYSSSVNGSITNAVEFAIGRRSTTYYKFTLSDVRFKRDVSTYKEMQEWGYLANGWISTNGNVTRTNFEFAQTAWSDTLCVPLPDATLGTNQEWVLTSSNIDDVTAWIGSRSSAKSVKKSITGGASFTANTTYFGDGFSLVSDSLVVVFPADTASIDNIVLKKAQHHLKSSANRGWLGW